MQRKRTKGKVGEGGPTTGGKRIYFHFTQLASTFSVPLFHSLNLARRCLQTNFLLAKGPAVAAEPFANKFEGFLASEFPLSFYPSVRPLSSLTCCGGGGGGSSKFFPTGTRTIKASIGKTFRRESTTCAIGWEVVVASATWLP